MPNAKKTKEGMNVHIWNYNDGGGEENRPRLFNEALFKQLCSTSMLFRPLLGHLRFRRTSTNGVKTVTMRVHDCLCPLFISGFSIEGSARRLSTCT